MLNHLNVRHALYCKGLDSGESVPASPAPRRNTACGIVMPVYKSEKVGTYMSCLFLTRGLCAWYIGRKGLPATTISRTMCLWSDCVCVSVKTTPFALTVI